MSDSKHFSTREWLLVIAIIMISEFSVLWFTYLNATDKSVLDNFSLAGTITSMILAVLAIVYSFYQSYSQQQNAENIAAQIAKLNEVVTEISESETKLGAELQQFSVVKAEITETVRELHGLSKSGFQEIAKGVNNIEKLFSSRATEQAEPTSLDSTQLSKFVDALAPLPLVVSFAMAKIHGREYTTSPAEAIHNYWIKASEGANTDKALFEMHKTVFVCTWSILKSLGLITATEKKSMVMSDTFRQLVTERANQEKFKNDQLAKIAEELKKF